MNKPVNEPRRKLLHFGLLAAPLLPSALLASTALTEGSVAEEQWYWYPGHALTMKSTGKETNGTTTWMLIENSSREGVPFHKHLYEDESFYVVDGLFEITVGERTIIGGPGTYAYGPRNVPHRWTNMGSARGRLLNVYTPSGIEGYFLSVAIPVKSPTEEPPVNLVDFQAQTASAREKFGISARVH